MKSITRLLALCLAAVMLTPLACALAGEDGYSATYTYNYDYWNEMHESPDAYQIGRASCRERV